MRRLPLQFLIDSKTCMDELLAPPPYSFPTSRLILSNSAPGDKGWSILLVQNAAFFVRLFPTSRKSFLSCHFLFF